MADVKMPDDIVQWIEQQGWGSHHLEWHVTRLWDARPAMRALAQSRGWQRASVQEGAPGNGLAFLAMHRVMIRQLVAQFPQHVGLFRGWQTPPLDPDDPSDPVPPGQPRPFDTDMQNAITRVETAIVSFASDDELGLYLETNRRWSAANPGGFSNDLTTGVHNYIHGRFSIGNSLINMGDPQVNLLNQRFWRLHGWIEARWTQFRQVMGLTETQPAYVAAIQEAEHHMGMHMMPMMMSLATKGIAKVPATPLAPALQSELFSWGAAPPEPAAAPALAPAPAEPAPAEPIIAPAPDAVPLAGAGPTWEGDVGQNNGIRHMFRPVDISCMKSQLIFNNTGRIYLLDDYDDVKASSIKIYGMLKTKLMPPDEPWTTEKLAKFKQWMDLDCPRG